MDAERGAFRVGQPVDGQPAGDVVGRRPYPGNLRVVRVAIRHEILVQPGADEVSQWHPLPQAYRQGDGVAAEQPRGARARLAPVDEDLAEAPVLMAVRGEMEPLVCDLHADGVSAASPGQLPAGLRHHGLPPNLHLNYPNNEAR